MCIRDSVKRIAEIFSHFRNPDKETVLTPWRVVNLHLSNMVGGYSPEGRSFYSPSRRAMSARSTAATVSSRVWPSASTVRSAYFS